MTRPLLFLIWCLPVLNLMLLGGCGSERDMLHGRVLSAYQSGARFVDAAQLEDGMIRGEAIPGARVELVRDPRSLRREVVADATTDHNGDFSMKVDAFGAGWMSEEWLVRCVHPGYPMVELFESLPTLDGSQVLLIDMSGSSASRDEQVISEQERMRRELDRYAR